MGVESPAPTGLFPSSESAARMAVGIGLAARTPPPAPPRPRRSRLPETRRNSDVGPKTLIEAARTIPRSVGPRRRASTPGSGWSPRVRRTVASRAATAPPAPLSSSDAVVRFVALGFGSALVPCSAATTRPDDVAVVELADPAARHPISLVHRHPAPTAPSARPPSANAAVGAVSAYPMVNFRRVGMAQVTSW